MERYRILPHPADGKFRAYGRTLEEAFGNAALATASLMWDWKEVDLRISIPVRVAGKDREQLLVSFLGEVIYLLETRDFLLGRVDGLKISAEAGDLVLEAVFRGDAVSDRYEIHGQVKAVTYHEMKIEEAGGFSVQAVVDM